MSTVSWIIPLFKVSLVADLIAIVAFVADYTRLAPWWRNPIGRTIVTKDVLLAIPILLAVLSIFFHFNRTTSVVSAWVTVVAFGLICPTMLWRIFVFERVHRKNRSGLPDSTGRMDNPGAKDGR